MFGQSPYQHRLSLKASSLAQNTTLFWAYHRRRALWPYPRKGQVYPARRHHRHPLRSRRRQLPSPPWNRPETSSTFAFPSLTPPPFTYLTDSRTSPISQMTPTVASSSSTFHFHPPCLLIFSQRKKFCILPTSDSPLLPALLAMFSPES